MTGLADLLPATYIVRAQGPAKVEARSEPRQAQRAGGPPERDVRAHASLSAAERTLATLGSQGQSKLSSGRSRLGLQGARAEEVANLQRIHFGARDNGLKYRNCAFIAEALNPRIALLCCDVLN